MRNTLKRYEKCVVLWTKCGSYYEKCRFEFLFSLCYIVDLQKNIVRVMRI